MRQNYTTLGLHNTKMLGGVRDKKPYMIQNLLVLYYKYAHKHIQENRGNRRKNETHQKTLQNSESEMRMSLYCQRGAQRTQQNQKTS